MNASASQVGGSHYKKYAIQPSEYNAKNNLGWCEGNVVKYVTRHKDKGGRQDIEKAIHYLQLLLEWEYSESKPKPSELACISIYSDYEDDEIKDLPMPIQEAWYIGRDLKGNED